MNGDDHARKNRAGASPQTIWASVLIDGLVRAGVRRAVVSSGARSAALVIAAAEHESLHVTPVADERAAAFFALGQARATGSPTLLVCTSGTAGAHWYPAVIEAAASRVPLVAVTADRPPESHGCGAPQTIDQTRLFGVHARRSVELGMPRGDAEALRALHRKALGAVADSLHPIPGPVHLNAPFAEPLGPEPGAPDRESMARAAAAVVGGPAPESRPPVVEPDRESYDRAVRLCREARRPVFLGGPAPVAAGDAWSSVERLARRLGAPILAEGASQYRFTGEDHPLRFDGHDLFLAWEETAATLAPDLVLQFGAYPTSAATRRWLAATGGADRLVVAPLGRPDPPGGAALFLHGAPERIAARLLREMESVEPSVEEEWAGLFAAPNRRALDEARRLAGGPVLSEARVARTVTETLPDGAFLAVGNSNPIRTVDRYCPGSTARAPVLAQRGANGIDGLVSAAAGAAVATGRPVTLLLGDLSFLHDLSGLAAAREATTPFAIVVVRNDGGRIFESHGLGSSKEAAPFLERYMIMPHGSDLAHAARLFDLPFHRAVSDDGLREALGAAAARRGATVIEATIPPRAPKPF
ncbi:MAG: 2-succinyl-5-enolpyruvyl-6-hydroxy-3-cyclohexene-1-carboxylic-acid synthase [Candidatus Eisenbacteria bacterium]|nr:2-succinyl-5-enolpyruvyl-6-hydroxy-3-cyclohexene-1-carboxylic-acid synthase [Candidatus Eisenbacteria bacterium]